MPCHMQVQNRLGTAIQKSHGSNTEKVVRAVARACLTMPEGFQACNTGYLVTPVSYSRVARCIRQDFADDFTNPLKNSSDSEDEEGYNHYYTDDTDYDETSWILTGLLCTKQCSRYFKFLRKPPRPPYVIADLSFRSFLVVQNQMRNVQDVLPLLHTVSIHPDDPAYANQCARLKTTAPSKRVYSNTDAANFSAVAAPRVCLRSCCSCYLLLISVAY